MTPGFASESLPGGPFELDTDLEDLTLPHLFIGLEIDLLAPGDGIVTDRHHASASNYEADDAMNQIGGSISPFTLSGWLRHACEAVLQTTGATACHPGEPSADYMREAVYERDLENGYHERGSCVDSDHDAGCVLYDLFGGFDDQPGKLLRRPISFSPIRREVDVLEGEAEAHYRQLQTHVRSRNERDGGQPLRQTERDVVGNLEGTWKLTLRECKPEFVGLLVEAAAHLDTHSDEYRFQVGGARNFGAGIADVWVVNPLFSEAEITRSFNRSKSPTQAMEEKDDHWRSDLRDRFVEALQARVATRDSDLPVPERFGGDGS